MTVTILRDEDTSGNKQTKIDAPVVFTFEWKEIDNKPKP